MDKFDFFIIDEISMICDSELEEIINYVCKKDKKAILIGDNCQIPSPSQKLIVSDYFCIKPDSFAFDIVNAIELTEIVRQDAASDIIKIGHYMRNNLNNIIDVYDIFRDVGLNIENITCKKSDIYSFFKERVNQQLDTRIIAYTNAAVKLHNNEIRKILQHTEILEINELLTSYANVGFPNYLIENGVDYRVVKLRPIKNKNIFEFSGLCGHMVILKDIVSDTLTEDLFFIDINNTANYQFLQELIRRAEKVNKPYSKSEDFKLYFKLKNKTIFMNDVYKFGTDLYTEENFKGIHPLLFTKISMLLTDKREKINSVLSEQIEDLYGDIIGVRINDNKNIVDSEVLADQFMIIEKDITYGYSITAHKSQGSTYDSVFVDYYDFEKIKNMWNYKYKMEESRIREKNQLLYVSYTRPRTELRIIL